MTPAGLPSQTLWPYGREPMSIAFFRTPGTDRLYSGVAKMTASTGRIWSRNAVHSAVGVGDYRSTPGGTPGRPARIERIPPK